MQKSKYDFLSGVLSALDVVRAHDDGTVYIDIFHANFTSIKQLYYFRDKFKKINELTDLALNKAVDSLKGE